MSVRSFTELLGREQPTHVSGVDTTILLAVSAWLIVNSHMEAFYPYRWLAADGLLGNTMFFFLSGFGVQCSLMSRPQAFSTYYGRRLSRLYPSVFIVLLVFWVCGIFTPAAEVSDLFGQFVWPTQFNYVTSIVLFYVLVWLLDRAGTRGLLGSMAVALMVFAWWYFGRIGQSGSASKLSIGLLPAIQLGAFFWIVTASGCLAARMRIASEVTLSRLGQGAALILIYFGLKFMMVVKGVGVAFYPVLLLLSLGICLIALRTLCAPNFVRSVIAMPALGAFLAISGALTLQIYLFHSPLASLEALSSIVFPLNIAVFGLLVLIGAALVKLATDAIAGALDDLSRMSRRPIF